MTQLSPDQQAAFDKMVAFVLDPSKTFFVLEGFAGSGKSTLMDYFMDYLPKLEAAFRATNSGFQVPGVDLSATTHKAAENLSVITGHDVRTIHSVLGLRLATNYKTNKSYLEPRPNFPIPRNMLIIVDEASYIDLNLLHFIKTRTQNCKVIFMGDPYQLVPVGYNTAPVFQQGFETVKLTGNHRNQSVIQEFSAKLRNTIDTGDWFQFKPDGHHIVHMDRTAFNDAVIAEFTRPDWKHNDSRVLSYTNDRSIEYNNYVQSHVKGNHEFQAGDYARSNKYTQASGSNGYIRNDETVFIVAAEDTSVCGVAGKNFLIKHNWYFAPNSLKDVKALEKESVYAQDSVVLRIMSSWLDLRAHFSETVNKSQGSTYGKVFIDLDDVASASNGTLIARLLYVAASRAKHQVILTGDLV